jgi:hypothetical protein
MAIAHNKLSRSPPQGKPVFAFYERYAQTLSVDYNTIKASFF